MQYQRAAISLITFMCLALINPVFAENKRPPDFSRYKNKNVEAQPWLDLLGTWNDNWSAVRTGPYAPDEANEQWQNHEANREEFINSFKEAGFSPMEALKSYNETLARLKRWEQYHARALVDGGLQANIINDPATVVMGNIVDSSIYSFRLPVSSPGEGTALVNSLAAQFRTAIKSRKKEWAENDSSMVYPAQPLSFVNFNYNWRSKTKNAQFGIPNQDMLTVGFQNLMHESYPEPRQGFVTVTVSRLIHKE